MNDKDETRVRFLEERLQKAELAHDKLSQENRELKLRVDDLEKEVSNARSQGLELEKDLVTTRLELEALASRVEGGSRTTP